MDVYTDLKITLKRAGHFELFFTKEAYTLEYPGRDPDKDKVDSQLIHFSSGESQEMYRVWKAAKTPGSWKRFMK